MAERTTDPLRTVTGPARAVPPSRARSMPPRAPASPPRTLPPRPAVALDLPHPLRPEQPDRPRAIRVCAGLWFAVCAAGALGGLATLADGHALRDRLTVTARAAEPTATAAAVDDAVLVTMLLVLGALGGLLALTVVGTAQLLRRRSWARWMLLLTGPLTLFVADVAQSLVTGGADLDRIAFLVQMGLVVPAAALLLARSSRAWLRRGD